MIDYESYQIKTIDETIQIIDTELPIGTLELKEKGHNTHYCYLLYLCFKRNKERQFIPILSAQGCFESIEDLKDNAVSEFIRLVRKQFKHLQYIEIKDRMYHIMDNSHSIGTLIVPEEINF